MSHTQTLGGEEYSQLFQWLEFDQIIPQAVVWSIQRPQSDTESIDKPMSDSEAPVTETRYT